MSERERTETDIEFDFFDDSPVAEAPTDLRPAARRRRPRLPRRPPDGGGPLLRMGALLAGAIVLAALLVLVVNRCREGQRHAAYENYVTQAGGAAGESEQIGRQLSEQLTTPGIKLADLRGQLAGLRDQHDQLVARVQELEPPGRLREQQESLVEAFQFRVSGLNGLAQAFGQIGRGSEPEAAGRALAEQSSRLLASDVVYDDLFKAGTEAVLRQEGVSGVAVPDSNFLPDGVELASGEQWTLIVKRLTARPAAGGLRGNSVAGVRVQPGDQTLSPTEENTVEATERLAFHVLVENSGESQETQVPVTLTIQQSPEPIRRTETVDIINPGETKVVAFADLAPAIGILTTVKVVVEPVVGEENTANNSAEYRVIFTLP